MKKIPMTDWGKDHWSMLAYIECRVVDNGGTLDERYMRANPKTHPHRATGSMWKGEYGTRLKGFYGLGHSHEDRRRPTHDDWDCLDDIEAAGLIEWKGTGLNPIIKLTKLGLIISGALRVHKASGGNFAEFEFALEAVAK